MEIEMAELTYSLRCSIASPLVPTTAPQKKERNPSARPHPPPLKAEREIVKVETLTSF